MYAISIPEFVKRARPEGKIQTFLAPVGKEASVDPAEVMLDVLEDGTPCIRMFFTPSNEENLDCFSHDCIVELTMQGLALPPVAMRVFKEDFHGEHYGKSED